MRARGENVGKGYEDRVKGLRGGLTCCKRDNLFTTKTKQNVSSLLPEGIDVMASHLSRMSYDVMNVHCNMMTSLLHSDKESYNPNLKKILLYTIQI